MSTLDQIKKQKQTTARDEQSLAMVKLKKRKADTRRKIELGGLVIKASMDGYSKAIILGALDYALKLMIEDCKHRELFEANGQLLFLNN